MQNITLPKLHSVSSRGKRLFWEISVKDYPDHSKIICCHGQEGGKKKVDTKEIYAGKNIGKKNETTFCEQARLEAKSTFNRKIDSGYSIETPELTSPKRLPMLAHSYSKRSHDISWEEGVYLQPKLDGIRCCIEVTEDAISFRSRLGKDLGSFPLIEKGILGRRSVEDREYDGELFTHELSFQEIISAIKDVESPNRDKIEFHCYDIMLEELTYDRRIELIVMELQDISDKIIAVRSDYTSDPKDLDKYHQEYISEGYEGTMIRNSQSLYKVKHRSKDLQKYKDFFTEEYEIVGVKEATGTARGQGILQCITPEGGLFGVRTMGTDNQRRDLLLNKDRCIGKMLTVQWQELTDSGIPRFPVGVSIRDYE